MQQIQVISTFLSEINTKVERVEAEQQILMLIKCFKIHNYTFLLRNNPQ